MNKQPLFKEHKEIVYDCLYEYLRKSEESCSYVRKQVLNISTENKDNNYEQMKPIAQTYASNQECSIQEAVYHCLLELWLRKVFPGLKFQRIVLKFCVPNKKLVNYQTKEEYAS